MLGFKTCSWSSSEQEITINSSEYQQVAKDNQIKASQVARRLRAYKREMQMNSTKVLMISEKDKQIIDLKKHGKTIREIAEKTQSSFSTISRVLKMAEDQEMAIAQNKTMQEEENQARARYTQAMKMFSQGKSNIEVAKNITGMRADEILSIQA